MDKELHDFWLLIFFHYFPHPVWAWSALSVFLLLTLTSLYATLRSRTWFTLTIPVTAMLETFGYAWRIIVINRPTIPAYVTMGVMLVTTPTLLAIALYMTAGRLLRLEGKNIGQLRPHWVSRFFITGDVLTLLIQCSGGGFLGTGDLQLAETGEVVILAGLGMQLCFFAAFAALLLHIQTGHRHGSHDAPHAWKMFAALNTAFLLLAVRNVYRVIEFSQGLWGWLAVHEPYTYMFDTLPVASALIVLTIWHPGRLLNMLQSTDLKVDAPDRVAVVVHVTPHKDRQTDRHRQTDSASTVKSEEVTGAGNAACV